MLVVLQRYPFLCCLSTWFLAGASYGAAVSEEDVLGDIPMASIASRLDQPLNRAPASVTIIDRALLDASGAQTWADVFRLVPGFQSYAVNGNRFGVSYHGFGEEFPNRLEVMVDGRSVYEPVFSAVTWSTLGINFADIDHIEIVRGSSTPSQGSNALLAAVNIVTRAPVQDSGTAISYTSGSRSTRNATLRHNDRIGGMFYRLSLGYQHNDGFPAVTDEGPLDDGRELYQLAFRGTLTPTLYDSVEISWGFVENKEGLGDGDHPDEYLTANYDSNYQMLTWLRSQANGGEIQLRAYHNSLRVGNKDDRGLISQAFGVPPQAVQGILGIPDQKFTVGLGRVYSERYDLELEQQFSPWLGLRSVWGFGVRVEAVESELLFGHDDNIREESYRFFTHHEWSLGSDWLVNAGLMLEDTHVGNLTSPRLALNYEFITNHTLRLGLGRSERAPSIAESNLDRSFKVGGLAYNALIRSGQGLGEERVEHAELAYMARFPVASIDLDLRVFREEGRDGLDAYLEDIALPIPFFDDQIKVLANTGEWETSGVELQLSYRPLVGSLVRLNYTYLDLESDFLKYAEPTEVRSDFNNSRPRHSGSLLLAQQLTPRLDASVMSYYQSDVVWRGGNPVDEFLRIDAQLTYQFLFAGAPIKLQAVAQNLAADYAEFSRNNVFETRFYIKVEVGLP
ncbi:MAG: TonB-dependent receptor [Porticoccaceae bacterium]|nr:TonB-dependent receptor [Porticoccaceae bacterium]